MAAVPYRTGLPTTQKTAKVLCQLIARHSDTILILANNDPAVSAALAAALAACAVLDEELEKYRQYGD